jgi:L-asparaginase II
MLADLGVADTVSYLRSSLKAFQTLPVLMSGAADHFGFNDKEVALACASHNGEPIHTEIVSGMLHKIGIGPEMLKCGIHEPYDATSARTLREKGEKPTALHNNCSGKHAAMLAFAKHTGAPLETYLEPTHPVQRAILETVSRFSDVPVHDLILGVDGCSAPVVAMPIKSMALAYARLVNPPQSFDHEIRDAIKRIIKVMTTYPELIGGTSDRLDTEIMKAVPGQLISKVGAEGVYTAGVLPNARFKQGFGLALKIEDGDDHRARPTVVIEALRQLGVLRDGALHAVSRYASFAVKNRNGNTVGEIRASFALQMSEEV